VGILGNDVLFLQNQRTPATTRKPNHKNTQANSKTSITSQFKILTRKAVELSLKL